jgi:hypothetical protein
VCSLIGLELGADSAEESKESIELRETPPDDDPDNPKSAAGGRTISLDTGTVDALRAWRVRQNNERLIADVDRKLVCETVGHSRRSFTDDVYGVVVPEVARAAANATAAVVPRERKAGS